MMRWQHFGGAAKIGIQRDDPELVTLGDLLDKIGHAGQLARQADFSEAQFPGEFPDRDAENDGVIGFGEFGSGERVSPSSAGQIENGTGVENVRDHSSPFHSDSQTASSV